VTLALPVTWDAVVPVDHRLTVAPTRGVVPVFTVPVRVAEPVPPPLEEDEPPELLDDELLDEPLLEEELEVDPPEEELEDEPPLPLEEPPEDEEPLDELLPDELLPDELLLPEEPPPEELLEEVPPLLLLEDVLPPEEELELLLEDEPPELLDEEPTGGVVPPPPPPPPPQATRVTVASTVNDFSDVPMGENKVLTPRIVFVRVRLSSNRMEFCRGSGGRGSQFGAWSGRALADLLAAAQFEFD